MRSGRFALGDGFAVTALAAHVDLLAHLRDDNAGRGRHIDREPVQGLFTFDESGAELLVESVEIPFVNINTLLVMTPSDELAPNADYVVRILPSDG